jgi:hypothetical protein
MTIFFVTLGLGQIQDNSKVTNCAEIGFLPNGQMHVGVRVNGANLCEDIKCKRHPLITQTCFEG